VVDLRSSSILRQKFVDLGAELEMFLKISVSRIDTESCRKGSCGNLFFHFLNFLFSETCSNGSIISVFMYLVHMHVIHCFQ